MFTVLLFTLGLWLHSFTVLLFYFWVIGSIILLIYVFTYGPMAST